MAFVFGLVEAFRRNKDAFMGSSAFTIVGSMSAAHGMQVARFRA